MAIDRAVASLVKRAWPTRRQTFDGTIRFALVCVNFSTTKYLKLLLLTFSEQQDHSPLHQIVVVDNGSRDGGRGFLRLVDRVVPKVDVVYRRHRLHHDPAMRAGVRRLDRLDGARENGANVLLFCDADLIFRDPLALRRLADGMAGGMALAGEFRRGLEAEEPDIQASFFAVRRDSYAREDIVPLVHNGAPARRLQRSIRDAGLPVVHFASNHGGFILHRGRAGVASAPEHHPSHAYASVLRNQPHFMRVPSGEAIWEEIERRLAGMLAVGAEDDLAALLGSRFVVGD